VRFGGSEPVFVAVGVKVAVGAINSVDGMRLSILDFYMKLLRILSRVPRIFKLQLCMRLSIRVEDLPLVHERVPAAFKEVAPVCLSKGTWSRRATRSSLSLRPHWLPVHACRRRGCQSWCLRLRLRAS